MSNSLAFSSILNMVILKMFNKTNWLYHNQIILLTFAPNIIKRMAEKKKTTHGGKRPNAGRPINPNSKKQIALKLDNDLFNAFNSSQFLDLKVVRGQYINASIREKMQRDGLIE